MLDDPSVRGIVVNFREVTQRRALQDELVHQAFHDSLTGLANRALLIDRLGHTLTSASARGGRRSEERRVGKECVSTGRSRWSPVAEKKKNKSESRETCKV